MKDSFHRPYLIQLSTVTYDCNLRCIWCGIRGIPKDTKPIYMKKDLAYKISEDVGEWLNKVRIDFGLFGEPFLHKHFNEIVSYFSNNIENPWIIVYSNGLLLDTDKLLEYYRCGGNLMVLDPYSDVMNKKLMSLIDSCKEELNKMNVKIIYYDSKKHNFRHHDHHGKNKRFLLINDTLKQNEERGNRTWHTMGGNVDVKLVRKYGIYIDLELKPNKYCTHPFRDLPLKGDGTVVICCNDWKSDCVIAKYPEDGSLEEIWYSDAFMAVRSILRYRRTIPPCDKCSYHGGFRIGLEPKIEFPDPERFLEKHQKKYKHLKLSNARIWSVKNRTLFSITR